MQRERDEWRGTGDRERKKGDNRKKNNKREEVGRRMEKIVTQERQKNEGRNIGKTKMVNR